MVGCAEAAPSTVHDSLRDRALNRCFYDRVDRHETAPPRCFRHRCSAGFVHTGEPAPDAGGVRAAGEALVAAPALILGLGQRLSFVGLAVAIGLVFCHALPPRTDGTRSGRPGWKTRGRSRIVKTDWI